MAENLSVIALKLDQVADNQEKTDQKVSKLTERVLNPESGLFAKVQFNGMLTKQNKENVDELYDGVDKLLKVCESHETSVSAIEGWMNNHEERDNELRDSVKKLTDSVKEKFEEKDKELKPLQDDYTVRVSNKVWKDKVIWLIISALIMAIVIPPIVKLFKDDYQEKPKIETKIKK